MIKIDFNSDWTCKHKGAAGEGVPVTLPHDAMINEKRSIDAESGINGCWFEGYDYEYTKKFTIPKAYAEKEVTFEFEGVYRNAEVYINGKKAACRAYGYTNFYVDANEFLRFGEENEIKVFAENSRQPNSRWYSGAGIYRPVTMQVADRVRIERNGVKIDTLQVLPAVIAVRIKTSAPGDVVVKIFDGVKLIAEETDYAGEDRLVTFTVQVPDAKLWSPDSPYLYTLRASIGNDEVEETFGIRVLSCKRETGFCINGQRVIIRGACIHHDNGILGARCYAEAEERKIRILKENGYNAIRSAHNPCSKAMLAACDRLGMMVMDEYVDMWYIHKNRFDYADYILEEYERDITDMVEKDYNHPSVIMYSLGNEVAETCEKRGIEFFGKMQDLCHKLDPSRYVTCGVNIWFNAMYSMGFGQYSDEKAKKAAESKGKSKKHAVGSEFFNNLAGVMGADFMKVMATLPICDKVTKDCYAVMDVAGYNYGINRYKGDLKKYPERMILGSETFCSDAYAFWNTAKENPGIIGDFVWAGMDYLGEVGVGAWEYREYAPDFSHGVGWMTAGSGRIDLIGTPLGEALYTKVAFELEDKPQIAVVPVNHTDDPHSPSAWKFSNAIPSWSWNGLDGKKAKVEVYSRAAKIALYINGKRAGSKKLGKNCRFNFTVKYESGEITAVAYDQEGREISRNSLYTAQEETVLSVLPEKIGAKEGEVCFVRLRFTDGYGTRKPLEHRELSVDVQGGELLALGNACPFNTRNYGESVTDTYYGEAMAVVKAQNRDITVTATTTDGALRGTATIYFK